jgi:tetratricopeptide (TPR) repeat protein
VLFKIGRYEEAMVSYDTALRINPDSYQAWNNRGVALVELGRYDEAIESYDKALRINPEYTEAKHNRDELALKLK